MVKPGRKTCPCSLSICLVTIPLYNLKLPSYILKSHEYCCKNIITLEHTNYAWKHGIKCHYHARSSFFRKNYYKNEEKHRLLGFSSSKHPWNGTQLACWKWLDPREVHFSLTTRKHFNEQLSTVGAKNRSVFSLQEIPNSMNYWGILEVKFVP